MPASASDCLVKQARLAAPRSRVWRALTTPAEFGSWFGVNLADGFTVGDRTHGKVTNEGYQHLTWEITVIEMAPERLFSWTWHPAALEADRDYSAEAPTLVTFLLQDDPAGTLLTVVESGFDGLPAERRAEAFKMNEGGWIWEMNAIAEHLAKVRV